MRTFLAENRNNIIYYTFILMFIIGIFAGLYLGRKFLIPTAFGIFLAMLMLPVCEWLEKKIKVKWLAVIIADLIVFIFILVFVGFIIWQLTNLLNTLGQSQQQQQGTQFVNQFGNWLQQTFGINADQVMQQLRQSVSSMLGQITSFIQKAVMNIVGLILGIIVVLVYIFLFLFYRHVFVNFILKLVPQEKEDKARYIVSNLSKVTYQYFGGRLLVIAITAAILVPGLYFIGIKNALFFGVLAAFLDLLPYIGIIIGAGLPIIMAIVNHQGWGPVLWVVALFAFVQLLENYFLTPKIVGDKVKLNPLFVLAVVIIGGYIWGIAGLILFIPLLAMVKVLFDHVENLHPYGYLVGDPDHRTAKS